MTAMASLPKWGATVFFSLFLNHILILDQLEAVDDELDEIGILLVSTPDEEVAQEHGQDFFLRMMIWTKITLTKMKKSQGYGEAEEHLFMDESVKVFWNCYFVFHDDL